MSSIHIERKLTQVEFSFYPWEGFVASDIRLMSENQFIDLSNQTNWAVEIDPVYEEPFVISGENIRVVGGKLEIVFPRSYFEQAKWSMAYYRVKSEDSGAFTTWFGGRILLKR